MIAERIRGTVGPTMHRIRIRPVGLYSFICTGIVFAWGCLPDEQAAVSVDATDERPEQRKPYVPLLADAGIVECSGETALVKVKSDAAPCWCRTSDIEPGREIPQAALDAIETARAYLDERSMLPPEWRMCANPMNGSELHVTCWPMGRYLNSPVTLVVKDSRVVARYYSDTNDRHNSDNPDLLDAYQFSD